MVVGISAIVRAVLDDGGESEQVEGVGFDFDLEDWTEVMSVFPMPPSVRTLTSRRMLNLPPNVVAV